MYVHAYTHTPTPAATRIDIHMHTHMSLRVDAVPGDNQEVGFIGLTVVRKWVPNRSPLHRARSVLPRFEMQGLVCETSFKFIAGQKHLPKARNIVHPPHKNKLFAFTANGRASAFRPSGK